ncbi:hypothetical protein A9Q84_17295 [Halobacteriovorax marinus]|uniref:Uncharacterized protein n=1 Tax=Halobacteriovorax marinus TaxID=97084 RepID=A0A1Y5F3R0_9BACT|nr:hypothetical protein A9Q84_17295 [Halobacteriovorax marinus]
MGPIQKLYHSLRRIFFPNHYKIQSFTFYIPSPPVRKVGYREKEFDKIFYSFINQGFQILEFKTQANSNESYSGMWLIFIVCSLNSDTAELNLDDELKSLLENEEEIEGLYQIND